MPAVRCPACFAEYSHRLPIAEAVCGYCGISVALDGLLCPICHRLSEPESDTCGNCGEPLTVVGRALSMQADARRPPARLLQTRERALAVKESAEIHSRARMREMMEIEQQRQETLRLAMLERRAQDRRTLVMAGVPSAASFMGLILVAALQR